MIKITQQDNKLYTVNCYYYDNQRRENVSFFSGENMTELDLARFLQSRQPDTDTSFVVLKTGDRPAILTTSVERGSLEEK